MSHCWWKKWWHYQLVVVGFKFVTNKASILLLFLSKGELWVGAQENGFCFQAGLLYVLMFFYPLLVVGCQLYLLLVVVFLGFMCRLSSAYCRLLGVAVGCRRWFLFVSHRLLDVSCWLSVLVIDKFFHRQFPALAVRLCTVCSCCGNYAMKYGDLTSWLIWIRIQSQCFLTCYNRWVGKEQVKTWQADKSTDWYLYYGQCCQLADYSATLFRT
jgi:hypothetical protein